MSLSHAAHCARLSKRGKLHFGFMAASGAVRSYGNRAIPRECEHDHVRVKPLSLLAALATMANEIGSSETVLSSAVGE
jgi:hypothetical protein